MEQFKNQLKPSPGIGGPGFKEEIDDNKVLQGLIIAMDNLKKEHVINRISYDEERLDLISCLKDQLSNLLPMFSASNRIPLVEYRDRPGFFSLNMPSAIELCLIGDHLLCQKLYQLAYGFYTGLQSEGIRNNPVYISYEINFIGLGKDIKKIIKYLDYLYSLDTSILEFGKNFYIANSWIKPGYSFTIGDSKPEYWYSSAFYFYKNNPIRVSPLIDSYYDALNWIRLNDGNLIREYNYDFEKEIDVVSDFPIKQIINLSLNWWYINFSPKNS